MIGVDEKKGGNWIIIASVYVHPTRNHVSLYGVECVRVCIPTSRCTYSMGDGGIQCRREKTHHLIVSLSGVEEGEEVPSPHGQGRKL